MGKWIPHCSAGTCTPRRACDRQETLPHEQTAAETVGAPDRRPGTRCVGCTHSPTRCAARISKGRTACSQGRQSGVPGVETSGLRFGVSFRPVSFPFDTQGRHESARPEACWNGAPEQALEDANEFYQPFREAPLPRAPSVSAGQRDPERQRALLVVQFVWACQVARPDIRTRRGSKSCVFRWRRVSRNVRRFVPRFRQRGSSVRYAENCGEGKLLACRSGPQ